MLPLGIRPYAVSPQAFMPETSPLLVKGKPETPNYIDLARELETIPIGLFTALTWPFQRSNLDGEGRSVILAPGYLASERSMKPLYAYLKRHNFDPIHWGLGRNDGNVERLLAEYTNVVKSISKKKGGPVALVGWSLGGYLSREVARDEPDLVDQIITLGTPAWGGPKYTVTARNFAENPEMLESIEDRTLDRYQQPIQQPITAYFSKRDGIVGWGCCIDYWSPNVDHVEIDYPHVGMAFSGRIIKDITTRLVPKAS